MMASVLISFFLLVHVGWSGHACFHMAKDSGNSGNSGKLK